MCMMSWRTECQPCRTASRIIKAGAKALGQASSTTSTGITRRPCRMRRDWLSGDERLLGKEVRKVDAGGEVKATVPRHAVKMDGLRNSRARQ